MECFDGLCIGHLPIELNAVHVDGMLCNAIDISAIRRIKVLGLVDRGLLFSVHWLL